MGPTSASPSPRDRAGDVASLLSTAFLVKSSGEPSAFRGYDARMRAFISAIALSALMVVTAHDADRPNIVFIMSDDHAAHAIGAYGSRVNQTPNLDRLAREGALLTNVFATNSICTPSRAAILTGQYSHLNGVPVFNRFDSSRTTVAQPAPGRRLLHRHDRQVAPRQRSRRLRSMGDPAGPGRLHGSRLLRRQRTRRPTPGGTSPTSSPIWPSTSSRSGRGTSRSS